MIAILSIAGGAFVTLISLIIFRELLLERRYVRSSARCSALNPDTQNARHKATPLHCGAKVGEQRRGQISDPRFDGLAQLDQIELSVDHGADWHDETALHVYSEKWE